MSRDPWDPLGPFPRKVTKIPRYGGTLPRKGPDGSHGSRPEHRREPGQSNGESADLFRNLLRPRPAPWDVCKGLYTAEFACTWGALRDLDLVVPILDRFEPRHRADLVQNCSLRTSHKRYVYQQVRVMANG